MQTQRSFPGDLVVKNLPANAGNVGSGQEDPLEKEMAMHSRIPAWKIPWIVGVLWATIHGVSKS